MEEKGSKRNCLIIRDVTIMGQTVYNTMYNSEKPIMIVKEYYKR